MSKSGMIIVGLLLFAAAIGALGYRIMSDPEQTAAYRSIFQRAPSGSGSSAPSQDLSRDRRAAPDETRATRRSTRKAQRRARNRNLKFFELIIDILNVVVGLIGIGLAIWGMRARARSTA